MKKFIILAIIFIFSTGNSFSNDMRGGGDETIPPLDYGRVGSEFLAGTGMSLVAYGLAYGAAYYSCKENPDPQCPVGAVPVLLALPLFTSWGITLGGETRNQAGASYGGVTGYSYLGYLVGLHVGVGLDLKAHESGKCTSTACESGVLLGIPLLFSVTAGVIKYNMDRRYKTLNALGEKRNGADPGGRIEYLSLYMKPEEKLMDTWKILNNYVFCVDIIRVTF